MPKKLTPSHFLKRLVSTPVVDTRSPAEYASGHIPGAVSIPLFDDDERAAVGRLYKKSGRTEAVLEGLRLAGPRLTKKLRDGISLAEEGRLLMYCWRGGMRSESMAWLFSQAGIHVTLLEGGYKAYRTYILEQLSVKQNTLILGGLTGSGKTSILGVMSERGEQVADLESIACHRGSAFGALGQNPQPTTEHFANLLYREWERFDSERPVWLEDESRNIGSVFLPEAFWKNMQESTVIALISEPGIRLPRLVREYCGFPPEQLRESVFKISKRLGGDRTREAVNAIESGDF
ncbi:MAG: tRNA 2-selenouridine(34) synthase MnmH, partial [Bacteroidales bacterium]|nr:tRNA 2-selenouridine(34) synthase MnmH [Bacteroidales bacterium]